MDTANVKFPKWLKDNGKLIVKCADQYQTKERKFYPHHYTWIRRLSNFKIIDFFIFTHHRMSPTAFQVKDRPCSVIMHTYFLVFKKKYRLERARFSNRMQVAIESSHCRVEVYVVSESSIRLWILGAIAVYRKIAILYKSPYRPLRYFSLQSFPSISKPALLYTWTALSLPVSTRSQTFLSFFILAI